MTESRSVRLIDLDLLQPLPDELDAETQGGLTAILRVGGLPVGQLDVAADALPLKGPQLRALIASEVTAAVGQGLFGSWFDGWLPELRPSRPRVAAPRASEVAAVRQPLAVLAERPSSGNHSPSVSVVICTRHRASQLRGALVALGGLSSQPHEVLVIDNSDGDEATQRVVAEFRGVRYACEPRAGLSAARNTGIRLSSGDIIAFTDDDVRPSPTWLDALVAPFKADDVGAVTGLVLPASLSTEGELVFERHFGGFGGGFLRKRFDRAFLHGMRWHTPPVWKIGAGANMAVRRRVLELVGAFDERLGAGAAGCSEDSELWHRILSAGFTCLYEPAAVVVHEHRAEVSAVRTQLRDYMKGHVTALAVQLVRCRQPGEARRVLANLPAHYAKRSLRQRFTSSVDPTLTAEAAGYLDGLRHASRALRSEARTGARRRAGLAFLSQNPFPHPWTEGFYFREKMRAIHRVAPHDAVTRVLEVGGGGSGLSAALYPDSIVYSIDLDPAHARAAPAGAGRSVFVAADACRLPFVDDAFDVVTFFDVLEHIEDHQQAVREAQRVLAPGGSLLVTAPNDHWRFPYHRALVPLCPTDAEVMQEWGHVRRGYSDADLTALVGKPPMATATFINPVTSISHDLGFSRLPGRVRRALIGALMPLVLPAYAVHRPGWPGTETASWWRLPLTTPEQG
jgi:GT2 family glycosyltransferase/SAM-dependent methyltransferase